MAISKKTIDVLSYHIERNSNMISWALENEIEKNRFYKSAIFELADIIIEICPEHEKKAVEQKVQKIKDRSGRLTDRSLERSNTYSNYIKGLKIKYGVDDE